MFLYEANTGSRQRPTVDGQQLECRMYYLNAAERQQLADDRAATPDGTQIKPRDESTVEPTISYDFVGFG